MPIIDWSARADGYDLVVAGTGFGALFFVHRFVRERPHARVLMLEWGSYRDHAWQVANEKNGDWAPEDTYVGQRGEKPWVYTIGFGGGTNCWGGRSPRWSPNDFRLKTLYGVGCDWPLGYDDLEPFYLEAEHIMQVAGADDMALYAPRSGPFPQPQHRFSTVDKMLKAAMPDKHFSFPVARLRIPRGSRGACCASDNCSFCPTEAKFTALNSLGDLFANPRVDICTGARVLAVESAAGQARGVRVSVEGREHEVRADLVALACNAIQSPFILLRSGFRHPALGKYLHEKRLPLADVFLDGVDHFNGGTEASGFNSALMDGPHRRETGGALIVVTSPWQHAILRPEYGRWRQVVPLELLVEELPLEANCVTDDGGDLPVVHHAQRSDYSARGAARAKEKLPDLLKSLPVEKIEWREEAPTAAHVQGTVRMAADPAQGLIDGDMRCHAMSNLLVLGTAAFPSSGMVNPSLTAAALSLRAATRL